MRLCHLLEEVGPRGGRRDAIDGDARHRQLLAERFGEGDEAGLGRAVGRRVGVPFLAGDRGQIDDPAVLPRFMCGTIARAPSSLSFASAGCVIDWGWFRGGAHDGAGKLAQQ
jgi:hypothetical protein